MKRVGLLALVLFTTGMAHATSACPYEAGPRTAAPLLLLALAAGYWIITLAAAQTPRLRLIGNIAGGLILVVSLAGLICVAASSWCGAAKCAPVKMDCPMAPGAMAPPCHGSATTTQP